MLKRELRYKICQTEQYRLFLFFRDISERPVKIPGKKGTPKITGSEGDTKFD